MLKEYIQEMLPYPDELISLLEAEKNVLYIHYKTGLPLKNIVTVKKAWRQEYGGKV
ncbi:Uncharacterised protein [uncultured archaeon]|nr:Uncharacterised protein [uncultured archaeon]